MLAACGGGEDANSGNGADEAGNAANGSAGAGNGSSAAGGDAPGKAAAGGADQRMRPGEWEITVSLLAMDAPSVNKAQVEELRRRPQVQRSCVTAEQVARSPAEVFTSGFPPSCDKSGLTIEGGVVRGSIACTAPQGRNVRVAMDGSFAPEQFGVDQDVRMQPRTGPAETLRLRIAGRRLGECNAPSQRGSGEQRTPLSPPPVAVAPPAPSR
jgi:hypothetical protein